MLSDLGASYQRDYLPLLLEGYSQFKEIYYFPLWESLVKESHFVFVLRFASCMTLSFGFPFCVGATIAKLGRQINKINNPLQVYPSSFTNVSF